MGRGLANVLPILVVVVALLVVGRLMGFLASLQARACAAAVVLVLLLVGLIWWKYRRRLIS